MSLFIMSCLFKNCNARVHNVSSCYDAAMFYYRKLYRKVTYFVCPGCKTLSMGKFEDFLALHKGHLVAFDDRKDFVFAIGKLFLS